MTVLIGLILPDPRVQDAMRRAGCSTAWSWSKLWDDPMTKVATEAVYWRFRETAKETVSCV